MPSSSAVVGAPIVDRASRMSVHSPRAPLWKYSVMMEPTPTWWPWRALPGAMRSSWCEKRCSAPDAGREEPAMDMATPEETSAFVTIHADSSSPGLMESALPTSISAVICESAPAYSEYSTFFRRWASSQSLTAV